MSTPTEAHRKLWNQLRALGTQSREVHGQALQLLADSEARAVEAAGAQRELAAAIAQKQTDATSSTPTDSAK